MFLLILFVLLGRGLMVGNGIHEFTAMALLDGRMIDYYDNDKGKKVPKQDWMRERLVAEYWEFKQRKQQELKDIIKSQMNITNQNDSDIHVLQWMHGCEGEVQSDGSLTFLCGINKYRYDGNDFISFDYTNRVWVAHVDAAIETKRKWDAVGEYTMSYLKYECMKWLEKFMEYGKKQLREAPPPDVFLFAKKAKEEANIVLTCLATGFYPKDIVLQIRRNRRILSKEDGVKTTGVRPNEDHTFQRKDSVEILKSDMSDYTCEVIHEASEVRVERKWDHVVEGSGGMGVIIGAVGVVVMLVIAAVVGVMLYLKKRAGTPSTPSSLLIGTPSSTPSVSIGSSTSLDDDN